MTAPIDEALVKGLAQVRYALRALLAANEAITRSEGLTPQQFQAVLAIGAWEGPMALKDLADQLLLKHSAAVQLFRRLETTGLVLRRASALDRRIVHVQLTPSGENILMRIGRRHLLEIQARGADLCRLVETARTLPA